ncbi:YkvA family protein [Staphylococcus agnetis]|uniref:YkvA family protein n=1 Tax=Staphylococcus agnetis TaxID=985762 RepID=UPI0024187894|nr:YkvA family protein [Staphylococcus agnetis]MDG4944120.1 YkvA family protein [Staphylococcus agnetis]
MCYKDEETPLLAKMIALLTIAYALSPIDLIPDFIPILGYLDDVLIVPFGIWLSLMFIPNDIIKRHQVEATYLTQQQLRKNWLMGIIIICLWSIIVIKIVHWYLHL